jgi:hypothetical protein
MQSIRLDIIFTTKISHELGGGPKKLDNVLSSESIRK